MTRKQWLNRPYYSIGDYYREKFGERVSKISVNVADTCPNRLGLKGMQTCTFCDVWGSAAYADQREFTLEEQILNVKEKLTGMTAYKKFVVYFQSYTNSFMAIRNLEAMYEEALKHEGVVGLVIGTRPDCISPALINLWKKFSEKTYVSIELGAQSFYEDFLDFEKRGHTAQNTLDTIYKLADIPNLDIGLHFIFGHPDETVDHVIEQAKFIANLPIQNVKFHNLHVLKKTKLEKYYEQGLFKPIELDDYAEKVGAFIQHMPQHIAVQRLSALSSRWDELIAPQWTMHKMTVFQGIIDRMNESQVYQGQKYIPETSTTEQIRTLPGFFNDKIIDQSPFEAVLKTLPKG
jgi:radical SAM protein (TIGR01212 family)